MFQLFSFALEKIENLVVKTSHVYIQGPVYMEGGCPSQPSYPGRAKFLCVNSFIRKCMQLHARQCNPSFRDILSYYLRHPSRRAVFLPSKQSVPDYPASRGEKTVKEALFIYFIFCHTQ